MPRLRLAPLDFAGACLTEALGRARMGFQLGHCFSRFRRNWYVRRKVRRRRDFPMPLRLIPVYRKPGFAATCASRAGEVAKIAEFGPWGASIGRVRARFAGKLEIGGHSSHRS